MLGWSMSPGSSHNTCLWHIKTNVISILVGSKMFRGMVEVDPSSTLNLSNIPHLDKYIFTLLLCALFYVPLNEIFPKKRRHHVFVNPHFSLCVVSIFHSCQHENWQRIYLAYFLFFNPTLVIMQFSLIYLPPTVAIMSFPLLYSPPLPGPWKIKTCSHRLRM